MRGRWRIYFRRAISHLTGRGKTALVIFGRIIEIVQNDEILPAVAVIVEERRPRAPPSRQSDFRGFSRDVSKFAAAQIPVQRVSTKAGDEYVDAAVVVKITRGNSHSVSRVVDTRFTRDIGELKLAGGIQFVSVQTDSVTRLKIVERRALQQ